VSEAALTSALSIFSLAALSASACSCVGAVPLDGSQPESATAWKYAEYASAMTRTSSLMSSGAASA
jgi:hypothetical protein